LFLCTLKVKISFAMKRLVIRINGKQYEVAEGEELLIDRTLEKNIDPDVLLVFDDDLVKVGKPLVNKARVELEVLGEIKGEKIEVMKYKAKSRYRRRYGFRPLFTKVLVKSVSLS
jgi:large subunit ribosomal protein L21